MNYCMGCFEELQSEAAPHCPLCGFDESAYEQFGHRLPLRTVLYGKYMVGRVLGEGGFGLTYMGIELNLGIKMAIKEYFPSGMVTREQKPGQTRGYIVVSFAGESRTFFEQGRERFLDEARRLARFRSLPGIVSVNDFFPENGTAYIAMDYISGQTFKAYLAEKEGKLPAEEVMTMMNPLMHSLAKVHEGGIIHRDISPDNIMLDGNGQVQLIDFGAARDFAQENKSLSVVLKPGYAPPEQYSSKGKQGPWTDVYALCATMYRAMSGNAPPEAVDRIIEDTLVPPSAYGVEIDPAQEAILMKGLAVHVQERVQNMDALLDGLFAAPVEAAPVYASPPVPEAAEPLPPVPVVESPPPVASKASKKTLITALVSIAGAAAVLLAAFFIFRDSEVTVNLPDSDMDAVHASGTAPGRGADIETPAPEPTLTPEPTPPSEPTLSDRAVIAPAAPTPPVSISPWALAHIGRRNGQIRAENGDFAMPGLWHGGSFVMSYLVRDAYFSNVTFYLDYDPNYVMWNYWHGYTLEHELGIVGEHTNFLPDNAFVYALEVWGEHNMPLLFNVTERLTSAAMEEAFGPIDRFFSDMEGTWIYSFDVDGLSFSGMFEVCGFTAEYVLVQARLYAHHVTPDPPWVAPPHVGNRVIMPTEIILLGDFMPGELWLANTFTTSDGAGGYLADFTFLNRYPAAFDVEYGVYRRADDNFVYIGLSGFLAEDYGVPRDGAGTFEFHIPAQYLTDGDVYVFVWFHRR